ncbi:MAG: c-type cytochrome [Pirellulales bacterium]|nr:c-type cytochrome [Pirellulales bacterium]
MSATENAPTHRLPAAHLWARSTWFYLPFLAGVLALWWLPTLARAGEDADAAEEGETLRRPGLRATYRVDGNDVPVVERMEALPAMALNSRQSPDARLPAHGWHAAWSGVLEVLQPGQYRFSAESSGELSLTVGDQVVLQTDGSPNPSLVEGPEVELSFGHHPLRIQFAAHEGPTHLKLYWQSNHFAREPLPPHALGHTDERLAVADHFGQGWLTVEAQSCVACHRPSPQIPLSQMLGKRPGPKLSTAGARLQTAWIERWLADPRALRPEAVMPQLFEENRQGEIERYAVARFLSSLGGPLVGSVAAPTVEGAPPDPRVAEGETLFVRTGCTVCHESHGSQPARVSIAHLREKTTPESLAAFIQDPLAVAPAGLMPAFQLSDAERERLAAYLFARPATVEAAHAAATSPTPPDTDELRATYSTLVGGDGPSLATFDALTNDDERIAELARRAMEAKRCAACHEIEAPGTSGPWTAPPAKHDFAAMAQSTTVGCLADPDRADVDKTSRAANVPRFRGTLDRENLRVFLAAASRAPGTQAPGQQALLALERFNCTGCHERNGGGGLSTELAGRLVAIQSAESAEAVIPPSLTGVSDKLTPAYLHGVLAEGVRSRPWMSLQMPRFAAAHVAPLVEGFAALEGTQLHRAPQHPSPDEELAEAGRQLVGAQGFACTKCHDLLGVASGGTRGPDLAGVPERINHEWFLRWMTDPQRMQPGTRMPTVFLEGRSPYEDILQGDPARQREAIWHYLVASRKMHYPDGLVPVEKAYFAESTRPLVVRNFLPDLTPRAIAIRFPSRQHLAFDAQACRLAYAWSGGFLDMSPAWTERGGRVAPLEGTIYWTSPPGFPWEITADATTPPDFRGHAGDVSYGAAHPLDSEYHPSRVRFRGYSQGEKAPTFRYEYETDGGGTATFAETIAPVQSAAGQGVERHVEFTAPAGHTTWLYVGTSAKPPVWEQPDGSPQPSSGAAPTRDANTIVRLDDPAPATWFAVRVAPTGSKWHAVERDGRWDLVLSIPRTKEDALPRLDLEVWRPRQDTPTALEALRRELRAKTEHPNP